MLSGFNTNVKHCGVLFHVQTEDSGRAHPHVITHLYYGGTILASEKSSYKKWLDQADLADRVRGVMEGQHAAMLERLRRGDLDTELAERLGPDVFGTTRSEGASGHTKPSPAVRVPATSGAVRASRAPAADRPLDELILDYLVESTRRARQPRGDARRQGAQRKAE